jgi:hypothetical protein
VIFTAASPELRVRDAADGVLEARHSEHDVPCEVLESGSVYDLARDTPYEIDLALAGERTLTLFIEHLSTFAEPWENDCE